MKLPRGHIPRVTTDGRVEVHRHDEERLARGGFGERVLRSLGWRDGDGLGVGRQGRAEAVRVTQKLDNKGVRGDERGGEVSVGSADESELRHWLDREKTTSTTTADPNWKKPKQKKPIYSGRRQQGERTRD